jgi:hypothetical protein
MVPHNLIGEYGGFLLGYIVSIFQQPAMIDQEHSSKTFKS